MAKMRFGIFMAPFHPVGENPTLALARATKIVFDPAKDTDDKAVSSVVIWTRSLPIAALSRSGVSRATIRPSFMIAIRSQCSASSM